MLSRGTAAASSLSIGRRWCPPPSSECAALQRLIRSQRDGGEAGAARSSRSDSAARPTTRTAVRLQLNTSPTPLRSAGLSRTPNQDHCVPFSVFSRACRTETPSSNAHHSLLFVLVRLASAAVSAVWRPWLWWLCALLFVWTWRAVSLSRSHRSVPLDRSSVSALRSPSCRLGSARKRRWLLPCPRRSTKDTSQPALSLCRPPWPHSRRTSSPTPNKSTGADATQRHETATHDAANKMRSAEPTAATQEPVTALWTAYSTQAQPAADCMVPGADAAAVHALAPWI